MKWTQRLRRRRVAGLAVAVCALAVAAPGAVALPSELGGTSSNTDLRSPDTQDAALAAQQAAQPAPTYSDLRSPDTRDAARGVTTGSQSAPASPAPRTVVSVEEHGSQTLAIVFSSTALLIALLAVGFVAISRRPRPRWTAS
jgi:hypothetical protein